MTEQIEITEQLSSRKRRIVAFLIDHFIITITMVTLTFVTLGPNFMENSNIDNTIFTTLCLMIPVLILSFAKDSIQGISAGRWIMGIMVRNDSDNEIPSFIKLFIRNLLNVIWPIEFIVLAVSSDKKRIGDSIAKTKVLKNPNKAKRLYRILVLIFTVIFYGFFTYFTAGNALKNSNAYKVAIDNIEINEEILETTGGIVDYGYMPKGNINIRNGYGIAQLQITVKGNK